MFISPRKHWIVPTVVVILVLLHFTFSIWLIVKVNKMEDELLYTKNNVTSSVNRMYSQLYLINSRLNSVNLK
jgi:hypothetical protein